jgi:hypothetical protein
MLDAVLDSFIPPSATWIGKGNTFGFHQEQFSFTQFAEGANAIWIGTFV